MDYVLACGSNQSSVNNPSFSLEVIRDYGAWEWDIVSGDVQWFGVPERFVGSLSGRDNDHIQSFTDMLHPDDRARVWRKLNRSMARRDIPYADEYRVMHPDGSVRWISGTGRFYYDDTGQPVRMTGVVQDITERKQTEAKLYESEERLRLAQSTANIGITERKEAEAKLRESEARFRNVFEHAGKGIVIVNLDGNIVQCNPAYCAMLGYAEDELLQVHFSALVHVEDRPANLAETKRLLRGELFYFEIENRYVHKNGEPVWVRKVISLLRDDEGRPMYGLALVTDITERRKTEQELLQATEHLQRWAVELEKAVKEKTSELFQSQTRLRSLAGELSLAEQRERKRLAGELHDHLQQLLVLGKLTVGQGKRSAGGAGCEIALNRVDDILSEALTYSRTLVTELSPPVLRDHGLAAGLKWLGTYMKKHEQTVTVKVPEGKEVPLTEDQAILLFQSVRELLINSSKHAGTGHATVTMELVDGDLRIIVSDDGAGFDLAAAAGPHPSGGISSKFGLFSIQERMLALGGKFDLHSVPKQGTRATLMLSLTSSAEFSGSNSALNAQGSALPGRSVLSPLRPLSEASTQDSVLRKNAPIRRSSSGRPRHGPAGSSFRAGCL